MPGAPLLHGLPTCFTDPTKKPAVPRVCLFFAEKSPAGYDEAGPIARTAARLAHRSLELAAWES